MLYKLRRSFFGGRGLFLSGLFLSWTFSKTWTSQPQAAGWLSATSETCVPIYVSQKTTLHVTICSCTCQNTVHLLTNPFSFSVTVYCLSSQTVAYCKRPQLCFYLSGAALPLMQHYQRNLIKNIKHLCVACALWSQTSWNENELQNVVHPYFCVLCRHYKVF